MFNVVLELGLAINDLGTTLWIASCIPMSDLTLIFLGHTFMGNVMIAILL